MKKFTRRFIGGPNHGKIVEFLSEYGESWSVPVMKNVGPILMKEYTPESAVSYETIHYRARSFHFGPDTCVSFMVDSRLNEHESTAALAMFLAGSASAVTHR